MKMIKVSAISILLAGMLSVIVMPQGFCADEAEKVRSAGFKREDDAVKIAIRADKAKIDDERNAILEDGRQISEAKKAGDKAKVELLNQDIKKRKAVIRTLKDDINQKEGGGIDYGSGVRRRAK
jgi:Arc/MetJ-type ribon-helix-helix transcriptional regulator